LITEIGQAIQNADRILVTAHIRPDGDAIGSVLAMGLALLEDGKTVQMVLNENSLRVFSFLEGIDMIRMGLGQRRKYFALLSPDIRFQPAVLKGGYETLSFSQNAAVEIIVDPVTQPNRLYFEPRSAIKKYELKPIGWGGFDANKMHWREDYDQATMFLSTYTNLGVENRPGLTLLDDLVEPSNSPF